MCGLQNKEKDNSDWEKIFTDPESANGLGERERKVLEFNSKMLKQPIKYVKTQEAEAGEFQVGES